jgi:hypothetical protein
VLNKAWDNSRTAVNQEVDKRRAATLLWEFATNGTFQNVVDRSAYHFGAATKLNLISSLW